MLYSGFDMSHRDRDNAKLIARIKRIKGQLDGVERALHAELDCTEILRQIASVRGAKTGLTNEVFEEHLREHVVAAPTVEEREQGAEEMMQILKTYLK